MTKLNDTIADINAEVRYLTELLDTIAELSHEASKQLFHEASKHWLDMDSEEYNDYLRDYGECNDIMWHYGNATDCIKNALSELRRASDSLMNC